MEFAFETGKLSELCVDVVGLCVFEDQVERSWAFDELDRGLQRHLSRQAEAEQFVGKQGQTLSCPTLGTMSLGRVVVFGLGPRDSYEVADGLRYGAALLETAKSAGAKTLAAVLPQTESLAADRASQFLVQGLLLGAYTFERFLSEPKKPQLRLESVSIVLPPEHQGSPPHLSLARARVVAEAVNMARDLVNMPASSMTPSDLAERATALAAAEELECKVLGPKEIARQKMRLFLAVSAGSAVEPRFIHLTYRPKGKAKPTRRVVLAGKGVTFDSGGLSLKPTANMVDMKCDMAGAAAVLGVMGALPSLGVQAEVHGLIAATENMLSASSYKLGDVIEGKSGKFVEIVNTDAEGRLTLADALAYGQTLKPDLVVDIATLTGACMVALGPDVAGVMGNDVSLTEKLLASARIAGEEMWSLPLPKRLRSQLDSPVADLKNSGERFGGALTAGLFLKEFVGDMPWAHIDIAGPAYAEKGWGHIPRGGTGFCVATLLEFLGGQDTGSPA
jgi:leucyl aminopeptidase